MFRAISLGLVLFGTWLLLSGIYDPLILGFGVISCVFVAIIAYRMELVDHEGHPIHLGLRSIGYWIWLTIEIVKANIDVARRIVDPRLPISPTLFKVRTTQKSDLGQVIYANSITLTPGTVSLWVGFDEILVHAISREGADGLADGEMDRRATRFEGLVET